MNHLRGWTSRGRSSSQTHFCNTTNNTFCLWKVRKTERRGPLVPFSAHAMLAYQWRNPSAFWCRHPKSLTTRGKNMSFKNRSWQRASFSWIHYFLKKTKICEQNLKF
jgi:hypothetical protein